MKDSRPNGKKINGSTDYNWNVPGKQGWGYNEQDEIMKEYQGLRFKGKPQNKKHPLV